MSTVTPDLSEEAYPAANYLTLLVVGEEPWVRNSCQEVAEGMGFKVYTAENSTAASQHLELHSIDVVVLDVKLPGHEGGLELLLKIKQTHPATEVIMVTGYATAESVLTAVRGGTYDYLRKPFSNQELKLVLERVTDHLRLSQENPVSQESLKNYPGYGGLVGRSPEMEKLYRIIAKVASSRHAVLVHGENGSGKEMVARAIHFTGPFRDKPFISVDCRPCGPEPLESELFGYVKGAFTGAIRSKEGLLSLAKGGTVFLDEIAQMPVELQAKLLRALQEREIRPVGSIKPSPIDVRIIAATSRDLEIAMHQGSFRRDLYSRLNIVSLRLPTLRERKEDIQFLVDYFLNRISRSKGVRHSISSDAMKQLMDHDWPGNVRELENCVERACALASGPIINVADLPPQIQNANMQVIPISSAGNKMGIVPLAELEKQAILSALAQLKGDKLMTAKLLGIGKTTLYRKLREYGVTDRWTLAAAANASNGSRQAG